jgi:hypothetical protein
VGSVVELLGAKIIPSVKSGTVTAGAGHVAEPGEIELHGPRLIFITEPQSDGRILQVNLQTGDIGFSSGERPIEIYSEWTIQDGDRTLHEHKPTPTNLAESVVVTIG